MVLLKMMINTGAFAVPGTGLNHVLILGLQIACLLVLPSPSAWTVLSYADSSPSTRSCMFPRLASLSLPWLIAQRGLVDGIALFFFFFISMDHLPQAGFV